MVIGRVDDRLFSSHKDPSFEGQKLLLVQPLDLDGKDVGEAVLCIDGADAGVGDKVLVVQDGWAAMKVLGHFFRPVDAAVIGVIDRIDLEDSPKC